LHCVDRSFSSKKPVLGLKKPRNRFFLKKMKVFLKKVLEKFGGYE